jgi:hypothetical protein
VVLLPKVPTFGHAAATGFFARYGEARAIVLRNLVIAAEHDLTRKRTGPFTITLVRTRAAGLYFVQAMAHSNRRPLRFSSARGIFVVAPFVLALAMVKCTFAGLDELGAGKDAATSVVDARTDSVALANDSGIADAGVDASDSGSTDDAGPDASDDGSDGASEDGGPIVVAAFPAECPTGTVYSDPFTADPLDGGGWIALTSLVSYVPPDGSTGGLLALGLGGTTNPNTQAWIGPRPQWSNYTVSVDLRIDTTTGTNPNGGITFRMEDTPNNPINNGGQMYYAGISLGNVQLVYLNNGNYAQLGPSPVSDSFNAGEFYTLTVSVFTPDAGGATISVAVGSKTYITTTDTTISGDDGGTTVGFTSGSIGLRAYEVGMSYQNLVVTCD